MSTNATAATLLTLIWGPVAIVMGEGSVLLTLAIFIGVPVMGAAAIGSLGGIMWLVAHFWMWVFP